MTGRNGLVLLLVNATLAMAQDPVATFPNNYRVVLENRAVRVLRVNYGPHEKLRVHDHWGGPLQSMDAIEFTSEAFNVERVVCMHGSTCELKAAGPSVVAALTPLRVAGKKFSSGDVAWLESAESAKETGAAGGPAHLLRVVITNEATGK